MGLALFMIGINVGSNFELNYFLNFGQKWGKPSLY